jgi:RNA polymerase sigma-70 factor (ECF subfamily)
MWLSFRRPSSRSAADHPDGDLVRAAASGGATAREAFDLLAARHGPALRRYLRDPTRPQREADDLYQQTLVSAWEHVAQCRGAFRVWLLTIAANKVRDHYRSLAIRPDPWIKTIPMDEEASPRDIAGEAVAAAAREEALALIGVLLADEYAGAGIEIALRRWVDGWSSKEIADALGLKANAVDQRLFQMKKKLRESDALRHLLLGEDPTDCPAALRPDPVRTSQDSDEHDGATSDG